MYTRDDLDKVITNYEDQHKNERIKLRLSLLEQNTSNNKCEWNKYLYNICQFIICVFIIKIFLDFISYQTIDLYDIIMYLYSTLIYILLMLCFIKFKTYKNT
jgi:hypothetical protein